MNRRWLALLVAVAVLGGCGSTTLSPTSSAEPSSAAASEAAAPSEASRTPEPTSTSIATPSAATRTPEPTPTSIATQANAWRSVPLSIPAHTILERIVPFGGGLIAFANKRDETNDFVGGQVWRSADGFTWDLAADAPFSRYSLMGIAAGRGGIVVIGEENVFDEAVGPLAWAWFSPDGRSWVGDRLPAPQGQATTVFGLAAGPSGFVASGVWGGGDGKAIEWYSSDGRRWHQAKREDKSADPLINVLSVGSGYVAVGQLVWLSKDGRIWRRTARAEAVLDRVFAGNGWLLGPVGQDAIAVSRDGTAWQRVPDGFGPPSVQESIDFWDILATSSGFVALGSVATMDADQNVIDERTVISTAHGDPLKWIRAPEQPEFHSPFDMLALEPGGAHVLAYGYRQVLVGPLP